MQASEQLPFLLEMRGVAREARSRGRRCSYSPTQRSGALAFLQEVEVTGGTLEDAAEMMAVYRVTLQGWLDRATMPGGVTINIQFG